MKSMTSTDTYTIRILALVIMTMITMTATSHSRRVKAVNDYQRANMPAVYVDFIERAIGELADANEPAASNTAKRYMMELNANNTDMTSSAHRWATGLIQAMDSCTYLSSEYDGDYLSLTWDGCKTPPYSMRVRIARETFEGTDKAQADSIMVKTLHDIRPSGYKPTQPEKRQLTKTSESDLLVLPGAHYILNTTNGDTYYRAKRGSVDAVFSERYPVESLKNLMQSAVSSDYVLQIRVSLYGGKIETITLPLHDFTDYWKSDPDYYVYSDVSPSGNGYKLVHIAMHKLLRYAHISTITFGESDFQNPKATLKCTTVLNVPQHNIGNLFPDK